VSALVRNRLLLTDADRATLVVEPVGPQSPGGVSFLATDPLSGDSAAVWLSPDDAAALFAHLETLLMGGGES